jgi:tetratricopeptide (TPR) repeat protein
MSKVLGVLLLCISLFLGYTSQAETDGFVPGGHVNPLEGILHMNLGSKVKNFDSLNVSNRLLGYSYQLQKQIDAGLFSEAESFISKTTDQFLGAKSSDSKAKYAYMAADVYHYQGKYALAEEYFKRSLNMYSDLNNTEGVIDANIGISESRKFVEDFEGSLKSGYEALALADGMGRQDKVADIKNIIGRIFIDQGDSKAARPLIEEAKVYFEQEKDSISIALVNEDMAFLYAEQGDLNAAFKHAELALSTFVKFNDRDGYITSSFLLSELYGRTGDWDKALLYVQQSIDVVEKIQDKRELHNYYLEKAFFLSQQDKYEESLEAINSFKELGYQFEDPSTDMRYYLELSKLYQLTGNYELAMRNSELYDLAKDEFTDVKKARAIEELKIKYDTERRELELISEKKKIVSLELENDAILFKRNFWIALIGGMSIIALLVLNQARVSNKRDLVQKNQSLSNHTARIIEKNKLIENFEGQLNDLSKLSEEQNLLRQSKLDQLYSSKILTDGDWNKYKSLFNSVHASFLLTLSKNYPNLTEGDKRHLMLLKLNMGTNEMAEVLGVSAGSVRVSRHRIKKKVELTDNADLKEFCMNIG